MSPIHYDPRAVKRYAPLSFSEWEKRELRRRRIDAVLFVIIGACCLALMLPWAVR